MANAFTKGQESGGVKVIKVEARGEEEKEVMVRHEIVFSKWKTWNHENFSRDWSKKYSV